jgi:hypothetical protein
VRGAFELYGRGLRGARLEIRAWRFRCHVVDLTIPHLSMMAKLTALRKGRASDIEELALLVEEAVYRVGELEEEGVCGHMGLL